MRIEDIQRAPYVYGKTMPGRCRIEVNPGPTSRTHTTAECVWADKQRQPHSVERPTSRGAHTAGAAGEVPATPV